MVGKATKLTVTDRSHKMKAVELFIIMGLLSSIFGCKKKMKSNKQESPIENLEYAISHSGLWVWWASDSSKYIQLEFDWTMLLLSKPTKEKHPTNKLSLQFISPVSFIVLTKKESKLPDNWLTLFHEDKIKPFRIDNEYFSFNSAHIKKIIQLSDSSKVVLGNDYEDIEDIENKVQLGFWAGKIGLVVVADSMKIFSNSGEIDLNDIPRLLDKWWKYWKKYWNVVDTDKKLPYDPLCEINIPLTQKNMKILIDNIEKNE
jgi:hypothetical protein